MLDLPASDKESLMQKVQISNPLRNSERNALRIHGDIWEVIESDIAGHVCVRTGQLSILIRSLDGTDLRWWRADDAMEIPA